MLPPETETLRKSVPSAGPPIQGEESLSLVMAETLVELRSSSSWW